MVAFLQCSGFCWLLHVPRSFQQCCHEGSLCLHSQDSVWQCATLAVTPESRLIKGHCKQTCICGCKSSFRSGSLTNVPAHPHKQDHLQEQTLMLPSIWTPEFKSSLCNLVLENSCVCECHMPLCWWGTFFCKFSFPIDFHLSCHSPRGLPSFWFNAFH